MDLKDKVVIITGAASGLGKSTANFFSACGAKVALLDKKFDLLKQAVKKNGFAAVCDVTDEASIKDALQKVTQHLGIPRVCINCAGIATAKKIYGKQGVISLEEIKMVIDINLIGTINMMRLVAQSMIALEPLAGDGERGVIINTASVAAYEGQIGQVAYSASKGGIISLTLPAARDLASYGIRVMAIAPGVMETPMMANMPEEVKTGLIANTLFPKRLGYAKEFAQLAAHIVENPLLNGSVIRLDAGLRMPHKS